MSPPPLTKRKLDGRLYERPAEIEATLERVLELSRDDVLSAVTVRDRADPRYIPSECLVHLLRRTRWDNRENYFERLYKALMARVEAALPRPEHSMGERVGVDLSRARIRDEVRDRFESMLLQDRAIPGDQLDFYETKFAAGIAKLRATARTKVWRDDARRQPLEASPESNEVSDEVERAAGSLDVISEELWDNPTYRCRLDAAIDSLPPEQNRIIAMIRIGIPIESSDPNAASICKIEGCVEKTVRNRRDAAIRALRQALALEAKP